MPRFHEAAFVADEEVLWREPTFIQEPSPAPDPTGGGGDPITGDAPTGDPTTGGDGSGAGGLAPRIEPAVVIGLDLQRDALSPEAPEPAPLPTQEALSKDRRKRSMYTEIKRTPGPRTSGINL